MKKQAAFFYSFSDKNAGDFSLNIAAIDILIDAGFSVLVVSRFSATDEEFLSTSHYLENRSPGNVKVMPSPFRLNRAADYFTKVKNYIYSFLVLIGWIKTSYLKEVVMQSDVVVMCGGNVLRSSSLADLVRLVALNYPLRLARKLGREYIILPQSSAEIKGLGGVVLGGMLRKANTVFVREKLSFDKLKYKYKDANLVQSLDLAFFLMDEKFFKPNNKVASIALTIRGDTLGGLSEISAEEASVVERVFIDAVSALKDVAKFTIMVQGTEADLMLSKSVRNRVSYETGVYMDVVEEHDTFKLIELYSSFDLLIGMRLHSIILAAISGTPSYGVFKKEWGLKNPGIMAQLDLPYSYIEDYAGVDLAAVKEMINGKEVFQSKIRNLVYRNRGVLDEKLKCFL